MTSSNVIPDMLASSEAFTAFLTRRGEQVPSNATALLLAVTPLVLDATSGAQYDTEPTTGLATDTATAAALADATCIQALAWAKLKVDPSTGGVVTAGVKSGGGIGTAKISYADVAEAAAARTAAVDGLVSAAVVRLRQLNLLGATAWSQG